MRGFAAREVDVYLGSKQRLAEFREAGLRNQTDILHQDLVDGDCRLRRQLQLVELEVQLHDVLGAGTLWLHVEAQLG